MLTWPPPPLGAVPTKNIRWRPIQAASLSSMASKTLPMPRMLREQVGGDVLRRAPRHVGDLDPGQLAHPRELALGEVPRAALHRLDVARQQLLEAERLARG